MCRDGCGDRAAQGSAAGLLKRSRYEAAGIASYWIVDPVESRVTVLELRDGRYVEVADICGDESYEARLPFPVTITPTALIAGP